MFKTLREKIKILRKNSIWLKKEIGFTFEKYRLQGYYFENSWVHWENWLKENIGKEVKFIKISKMGKDYQCFEIEKDGLYIIGTEGIFYKKDKIEPLKKIWDKEFTGVEIYKNNVALIFGKDNNDCFVRLNSGYAMPVLKLKKIIYRNEKLVDNRYKIIFNIEDTEEERIIQKVDNKYFSYLNIKLQGEVCIKNNILFEDCDEFLNKKPVIASCNGINKIITLSENKIKEHYQFDELRKLESSYYWATRKEDIAAHILKYEDENQIIDLGTVPKEGKYQLLLKINDIICYKIIGENIVSILVIYKNQAKQCSYPGTIDVKLSEPIIFEDGNILSFKPTTVTVVEKTIEKVVE